MEHLVKIKENLDALDLGGGLPLGTGKEEVFKKLNKSEADLVNHVYLKLDNGFVYRISKGSKAISPDPEKEQITTIVANMEPVTQEEIESVFGEEYDSLTIDKNVTLTYRYKKSDKKNLLLIFMGNQESDHFTSSSLQYEPIRENLDGQKK
ncbi:hypothetical protein AAFJ72_09505 [Brevibacillus gelatini]|uniref:hypothetical protein n=1 Tax=Brevibacillus gelatini TaxID=1655277 RepID=UPI003D81B633